MVSRKNDGEDRQGACNTCGGLNVYCHVQLLLKCLIETKDKHFLGAGAAKNRFMKLLLLVFQLRGQ